MSQPDIGEQFNYLIQEDIPAQIDVSDAQIELVQQIHNVGGCYNTEKFVSLLKTVS